MVYNNDAETTKRCLRAFLRGSTCYDLMLHSSKVVVFDVRIPIKLALYALAEHGINTAPLWDPFLHDYVGMITPVRPSPILHSPGAQCPPSPRRLYCHYLNLHLTPLCVPHHNPPTASPSDIVDVIRQSFTAAVKKKPPVAASRPSFIGRSIASWRREYYSRGGGPRPPSGRFGRTAQPTGMIRAHPSNSLYDVCALLCSHGIHRLPLVHPHPRKQTALSVLTHLTILRHVYHTHRPPSGLFALMAGTLA